MERSLQQVIEALELGVTPDDLGTAGGLRASVKLSAAMVANSQASWRRVLTDWGTCRQQASAAGKLAVANDEELKRCSVSNRARPPDASAAAFAQWRIRQDAFELCRESTASEGLTIAQYQATSCRQGYEP